MARSTLTWLRAAVVAALATQTLAQTCYYPNGIAAPSTEKPCSTDEGGSSCCPDTWECLDNGLCHNPNGNLYGRYSCTDKNWDAPGCASNMCTYDRKAVGGEAITQCSNHNNNWCCNGDATNVNCCQEFPEPRPFFQLQDGRAYATIGRSQASSQPPLDSFVGLASGSAKSNSPSQTSAAASSAAATTSAARSSGQPLTSISLGVSSGPAGVVTVSHVITITPSAGPSAGAGAPSGSGDSSSKIGVIVGCAIGVPLALVLLGIIIWMLRKRHQQKAGAYIRSPEPEDETTHSPGFARGIAAKLTKPEKYRHSVPETNEIDGTPTGPSQPISNVAGRAELDSGAGFAPGHNAYALNAVVVGDRHVDEGSTWNSAPPVYSPGMAQTGFYPHNASELDDTSVAPAVKEKREVFPQQDRVYRPYNPMAELPTTNTPPADVEKQL